MATSQTQAPSPGQSTPAISISQNQAQPLVYESCLLVSRHKLLASQENDLMKICQKIVKVDMLPTDLNELRKTIEPYSAVVGIIPLPLQAQILQSRKAVLLFYMESIGTTMTKEEAQQLLARSGAEGVILPPVKEGEPYRVTVYRGLLRVKEIKIEDEFVIKH